MKEARRLNVLSDEIFVVGVDVNFGTVQNVAVLHEDFLDAQGLFIGRRVVKLGSGKLAGEKSYWVAVLGDNSTELVLRGIALNVERLVRVRVVEEHVLGDHHLTVLKNVGMELSPVLAELLGQDLGKFGQWGQK